MTQTLTVLLFAGLRQRIGAQQIELEVDFSRPLSVARLRAQIAAAHPEAQAQLAHCRVAIDQTFVQDDDLVSPGQELALIPPVSGGHDGPEPGHPDPDPEDTRGTHSRLTACSLSLDAVIAAVEHRDAGGIATFTGNIREHSRGRQVTHLEYEAYAPMAVAKMDEIAQAVEARIPGTKVALAHRVGRLEIGESAVVIAASAAHRAEAFAACREVIEELKREVPIWKREVDSSGAEWIGQGP